MDLSQAQTAPEQAASAAPPSDSITPETLRKRADFLRAASARRQSAAGFLLQAREREDQSHALRIGFTCSKKVGNSVMRNRARRRLREIARALLPKLGRAGWDYVLVGRPEATIARPYMLLLSDLEQALSRIHTAPLRGDTPYVPRGKRRGKASPPPSAPKPA